MGRRAVPVVGVRECVTHRHSTVSCSPNSLEASTVHLKAGDVLVQRGTIHNWVNRGTEPCVIAFVLIAANPVTVGGKVLRAQG